MVLFQYDHRQTIDVVVKFASFFELPEDVIEELKNEIKFK